jgi:hypothetical protein
MQLVHIQNMKENSREGGVGSMHACRELSRYDRFIYNVPLEYTKNDK